METENDTEINESTEKVKVRKRGRKSKIESIQLQIKERVIQLNHLLENLPKEILNNLTCYSTPISTELPASKIQSIITQDLETIISNRSQLQRQIKDILGKARKISEDVANGIYENPIPCYNDVDEEKPPLLEWVTERVHSKNFHVEAPVPPGCNCYPTCTDERDENGLPKCSCLRELWSNSHTPKTFPYNEDKTVSWPGGYLIAECNRNCCCTELCRNRVVQLGSDCKLALTKTRNKGWGVQTLEDIPKGKFIVEYLGVIVTEQEADELGEVYDNNRLSFLFDLDIVGDEAEHYAVDATLAGNIARFLNHSCDPNMEVRSMVINIPDPRVHHIGFFAKRKIFAGEELTFDYKYAAVTPPKSQDNSSNNTEIKCNCGAKNCRQILYRRQTS